MCIESAGHFLFWEATISYFLWCLLAALYVLWFHRSKSSCPLLLLVASKVDWVPVSTQDKWESQESHSVPLKNRTTDYTLHSSFLFLREKLRAGAFSRSCQAALALLVLHTFWCYSKLSWCGLDSVATRHPNRVKSVSSEAGMRHPKKLKHWPQLPLFSSYLMPCPIPSQDTLS